MEVKEININDIKPYGKNAKRHDEKQIDNVAESIKRFGFVQPCVVDKDNVLVIGHCRLLAAKKLKLKTIPCVYVDTLTAEQVKQLRLLDNKLNESEWDFDLLADDIGDLDFSGFDIDWGLPSDVEETEIVEDEPPEVDEEHEPICKLGDIWQLGRHKLICGDSTDKATVERLMDGKKADMVFTDPPYGMKKEAEGVLNDNLNYDDLLAFNKRWIPLSFEFTKENGSWYCWGIDEPLMDIYSEILKPMIKANKITFRNLITWDKGNGQGQLSADFRMYPVADEKCLFMMVGQQHLSETQDKWTGEFDWLLDYLTEECAKVGLKRGRAYEEFMGSTNKSQHHLSKSHFGLMQEEDYKKLQTYARAKDVDAFKREYEDIKREYEDIKREYYANRAYFDNTHDNMNNVWHFDRTSVSERELTGGHATPKPIALCSRAIKSSSREGEIVLDLFGGSGSTLIACEQLGRVCYMCEISTHYCDVIIKRWENFTGQKAVKIS